MKDNMKLSLNLDAIIETFGRGTATELARRLTEHGFDMTKQGVSRWRATGSLPMNAWLAICEIEARETKNIPDLRTFMRKGKP